MGSSEGARTQGLLLLPAGNPTGSSAVDTRQLGPGGSHRLLATGVSGIRLKNYGVGALFVRRRTGRLPPGFFRADHQRDRTLSSLVATIIDRCARSGLVLSPVLRATTAPSAISNLRQNWALGTQPNRRLRVADKAVIARNRHHIPARCAVVHHRCSGRQCHHLTTRRDGKSFLAEGRTVTGATHRLDLERVRANISPPVCWAAQDRTTSRVRLRP